MTLLLIYYLNFKLGWSQDPASQAPHEVRDRDYFFLWSFSAWGVWAALGLMYVWESVARARRVGRRATSGNARSVAARVGCSRRRWRCSRSFRCSATWSAASRSRSPRDAQHGGRPAELRRAVRRARHRRRQRHVPALVRAGGRRDSARRRRREHVAAQHRLVRAAAHSAADLRLRRGEGSGDLSRQEVGRSRRRRRCT